MPSVQVKDFPQELYDELKRFAERNHRSMSQQLVVAAEQMLHGVPEAKIHSQDSAPRSSNDELAETRMRAARRRELFARVDDSIARARSRGTWFVDDLDPVALIREDRDGGGRHGGVSEGVPS